MQEELRKIKSIVDDLRHSNGYESLRGNIQMTKKALLEIGDIVDNAVVEELDEYELGGDNPYECPKCGRRTEFVDIAGCPKGREVHTCPGGDCGYKFINTPFEEDPETGEPLDGPEPDNDLLIDRLIEEEKLRTRPHFRDLWDS